VASLASESPPTRPPPRSGRASRPLHHARRKGERCARATAAPRSGLARSFVPPPAPWSLSRALSWRPPKRLFTPTWHAVSQVAESGYALARRAMRRNNVLGGPVTGQPHVPPPAPRCGTGLASGRGPCVLTPAAAPAHTTSLPTHTPAPAAVVCASAARRFPHPSPAPAGPLKSQAPDMLGKSVLSWKRVSPTHPGNLRPPTAATHPWQEPHELYTKLMSCTSGSMSCHSAAGAVVLGHELSAHPCTSLAVGRRWRNVAPCNRSVKAAPLTLDSPAARR
jgi:hypothetical protein